MKELAYISRRIKDSYIVWIEDYNQWIQFEEPAFFVFRKIASGSDMNVIIRDFCKFYNAEEKESEIFIHDISGILRKLDKKSKDVNIHDSGSPGRSDEESSLHAGGINHSYQANGKSIRFSYENDLLEYYIHHSFAHLIGLQKGEDDYIFYISGSGAKYSLHQVKPEKRSWTCSDIPELKRRCFIEFGNALYDKDDQSWMSIIHGAALLYNNMGILLVSSTGSGKSTLAALLQKQGFSILSDDYIPLDAENGKIYPFPAAISIKKGSLDVLSPQYPELNEKDEKHFRLTNKSLKFMPAEFKDKSRLEPVDVGIILFVEYKEEAGVNISETPIPEALRLFCGEAWISAERKHAEKFIDWFESVEFYNLQYGDSENVSNRIITLLRK